jgi:hypothetical protein
VPLRAAFLMPDKKLLPLIGENGKLNREIASLLEVKDEPRGPRRPWRR